MLTATTLLLAGLAISPPPDDDPAPEAPAIRASVQKALPLLVASLTEYPKHRDCFSCHHQAVPTLALSTARARGFDVDPEVIASAAEHTEADLRGALESYKKNEGQGGGVTRAGYALFTLEIGKVPADDVTEAVAGFLLARDEKRDHWKPASNRPPSEASDFTATYLALRSLRAYARKDQAERVDRRREGARKWLESASPKETEDRAFRLLAMKESGSEDEAVTQARKDLIDSRNADGGWPQVEGKPSDAYATGSALVALHRGGGLPTDDPIYTRGLAYLIGTQKEDGSWFVASRSKPFQPYFESGFPHGKDQFISIAATAWSVTALSDACPKP